MVVHKCPLWTHSKIGRQLNAKVIVTIVQDLVQHGHVKWLDNAQTQCQVIWCKPEELATGIYQWATAAGYSGGDVCTCTN